MSRRPRVPGTPGKKTLYVLPDIHDDDPVALKNALAIRNACAVEGVCPGCGVVGVLAADPEHERIYHYTFEHEPTCPGLTDEAA